MSEPLKKPDLPPEGYSPKEVPEIIGMAQQAQKQIMEEPAMQQPEIITRSFLLAGFEAAIELNDAHWPGMDYTKTALKENLHRLGNLAQPPRFFHVWEADPKANYKKKKNHSKRLFFFGAEVTSLDGIPEGFVTKDFPETTFAVFKEREHGSPKFNWLEEAGYKFDTKYAEKYAMDIEIYDDIEDEGPQWDALIPIESYSPKQVPEILKLAGEINMNKPYEVKTANGGSYIDGVPGLRWGEFSDCTYSGCLALWLNAMGVGATYEQAAGLTGSCYRLSMCYGWDPGSVIVNTSYSSMRFKDACGSDGNANLAFGFEFYNVKDAAKRDEEVQKSIDAGMPVLALGSRAEPEWCVITGYEKSEDGGVKYFGRSYFDGGALEGEEFYTDNRYTLANNYPGQYPDLFVKLCGGLCGPLPAKEALKCSLETCLILFGKPKNWGTRKAARRIGYGAYKFMIDSLRKNEYFNTFDKSRECVIDDLWMHFSNLLDARRAAHIYLEQSAALLSGENRARLLQMAAMCKEMFDALSAVLPYDKLCNHEFTPGFSAALREEIIAALQKMLSLEKQARVIAADILKHW